MQVGKLQDLINRSKMARCRGRFVCPVILYKGKVKLHGSPVLASKMTFLSLFDLCSRKNPCLGTSRQPIVAGSLSRLCESSGGLQAILPHLRCRGSISSMRMSLVKDQRYLVF